ncbi:MAG: hypothetical protein ACT4P5_19030 [Armatimonadota bacterium]
MARKVTKRPAARPQRPKQVSEQQRKTKTCRCLSVRFAKTDWGEPRVDIDRVTVFEQAYTFLRIRVVFKYTIRCEKAEDAFPCIAGLEFAILPETAFDFDAGALLKAQSVVDTTGAGGRDCDNRPRNTSSEFEVLFMFFGDLPRESFTGTVRLRLRLIDCDSIPRPWTMMLRISRGRLDVGESDYDGDGVKNSDERGDGNPEWDPDTPS